MENLVDLWGRNSLEPNYNTKPATVYEVDAPASGDGVIYKRFFNREITAVHRITVATSNGRTSVITEVAYGAWADREALTYGSGADYPKHVEG